MSIGPYYFYQFVVKCGACCYYLTRVMLGKTAEGGYDSIEHFLALTAGALDDKLLEFAKDFSQRKPGEGSTPFNRGLLSTAAPNMGNLETLETTKAQGVQADPKAYLPNPRRLAVDWIGMASNSNRMTQEQQDAVLGAITALTARLQYLRVTKDARFVGGKLDDLGEALTKANSYYESLPLKVS